MPHLSFSFQYDYQSSDVDDRVRVPMRLRLNRTTPMLLPVPDTGSSFNIFRAPIAKVPGISYQDGYPRTVGTATGTFQAYEVDVTLEAIDASLLFETTVHFAPWPPGVEPQPGVLGLRDFATKLKIGLVHYDRMLYLADYNEP